MKLLREYIKESARAANGDCYEAAGKFMMDSCQFSGDDCNLILIHGEVMGQGPVAGTPFGHAWVLDGSTVIDKSNGRDLTMPMQIYYAIGQIDNIGNIHQYTWTEARKQILDNGHWGPWELVTESGL
jgi:hypothetical protein